MAKKNDKLPDLVVKGFYDHPAGKGGTAITLTRASVVGLLQVLGLGERIVADGVETFDPIHLSRTTALVINVSTPKGKTGNLVLGDASINLAHQSGADSLGLFALMLLAAKKGKQFALTVNSAEQVKIQRSKSTQVINLDPSAC